MVTDTCLKLEMTPVSEERGCATADAGQWWLTTMPASLTIEAMSSSQRRVVLYHI